jgi:phage shock protein E
MDWAAILIFVVVAGGALLLRRVALIPKGTARGYLQAGAVVVDVRTAEEFERSHIPGAVNLPLGGVVAAAQTRLPDRDQVLLVHCLAGGRSAVAQRLLKAAGYRKVFNLGSYRRAERIALGS